MLECKELVKIYGKRRVVDGVSLEVAEGEIVGLLGPNGAGKTTTFRMTVGLVEPNGGEVCFDGRTIQSEPMYRRARMGIGYLPQERCVFGRLTVRDNILAILETQGLSRPVRMKRLGELLDELDLSHLARSKAQDLSGGETRRLEITRAMVSQPRIIMLDEPFAGIDPIVVADIQQILRRLKDRGIGILLTDHSVRETLQVTERSYIINAGNILVQGPPEVLIADQRVRKIYLGEHFEMTGLSGAGESSAGEMSRRARGLQELSNRNFEEAYQLLSQESPEEQDAVLLRCLTAIQIVLGNAEEAISLAARAHGRDRGNPDNYFFQGIALLKSGSFDAAIADFDRALSIDPKHSGAKVYLACARGGETIPEGDTTFLDLCDPARSV